MHVKRVCCLMPPCSATSSYMITVEYDSRGLRDKTVPILQHLYPGDFVTRREFSKNLEIVIASPAQRSILWMVARTCLEPRDLDEYEEVCKDGFFKEFMATKTFHYYTQQVSYSFFFREVQPKDPYAFKAKKVAEDFIRRCSQMGIVYPVVNRTKNVSDSTTINYNMVEEKAYVRTVDLETLYHRTGQQIQGDCEMRMAWKFNDLKPRFYYCNGGTPYWTSRYVRRIAISLMESIPSTYAKLRTNPHIHLSNDPSSDYITTWDFTSFTSSLAELKHFLWAISRILEKEKVVLTLFDYRHGLIPCLAHQMLDTYNEQVNMDAEFSIHRVLDKFNLVLQEDGSQHMQMNNGMLGVAGNIGFSTALHGLVTSRECGDYRSVCVGDDALAITSTDPTTSIIKSLIPLGDIHPEKFGIIYPYQQDGYIKFLKRRFERVGSSFLMSILLNLPPLPYMDGRVGHRTIPLRFTKRDRIQKVTTQIGALYWELKDLGPLNISDDDWIVLQDLICSIYRFMDIPFRGRLSGSYIKILDENVQLHFTIPPCIGFNPVSTDWLEYMFETHSDMFFELPVLAFSNDVYPIMCKGDELALPESPFLAILEDLDLVEVTPLYEYLYLAEEENRRRVRVLYKRLDPGLVRLRHVRVKEEIPYAFHSMFMEPNERVACSQWI